MKKVSLAATVALSLLGATTFAAANGTVKSQPATKTATTVTAPATTAAAAVPATVSTSGALNPASAELIARPGNRRNTNFELDVMVPVFQPSCGDRLLAINIRGMRDVRRNTEGNFGAVYRQIINNSFVLGGYVYGDYRRTSTKSSFGQVTFGADILSNMVDARFNGYIAQNKKKVIAGTTIGVPVLNTVARYDHYELAQNGFDGEIGVRIPMPGMNNIETRIFAGGYRFSRSGTKTLAGPRGRLEVRILDLVNPGSRLTLGVDVSNDKVRKTTVNGVIGLRIPLQFISGGKVPQGLQRRLADYVHRDINVNTAESTDEIFSGNAKNADTGKDVEIRWTKVSAIAPAANSGTGTYEDPFLVTGPITPLAPKVGVHDRLIGAGTISYADTITPANGSAYTGPALDLTVVDATDNTPLTVLKATTDVITIVGTAAAPTLFTVAAGNPTIRMIGGFTHEPTVEGGALIAGTYTENATINISGVTSVGSADVDNTAQISVGFQGDQVTAGHVTVTESTFTEYKAGSAILVSTADKAKATVVTDTLTYTGATASESVPVIMTNTGGTLTYFDNGSEFTNGERGFVMQDVTTGTTTGVTTFNINGATVSGMNSSGVGVFRDDGTATANMTNANITGTISNTKFTSNAGEDISVGGGTGTVANKVNLTLDSNTHTNTGVAIPFMVVLQSAVNASTVTTTATNIKATGTALLDAAFLIKNPTANTVVNPGAASISFTGVTVAGYANAIGITGAAMSTAPGVFKIGLYGGKNVLAGTVRSFNGNTLISGTDQDKSVVVSTTKGIDETIAADTTAPAYNGQLPNGIKH